MQRKHKKQINFEISVAAEEIIDAMVSEKALTEKEIVNMTKLLPEQNNGRLMAALIALLDAGKKGFEMRIVLKKIKEVINERK